jgi:hypothetical protein
MLVRAARKSCAWLKKGIIPRTRIRVMASGAAAEQHPLPVIVNLSDSDDAPMVTIVKPETENDVHFAPDPLLNRPRPRIKRERSSDDLVFPDTDRAKEHLTSLNPLCVPRIRSSFGRTIRFGCKHHDKGCTLNVNAARCNEGVRVPLNAPAYTTGSCGRVCCGVCLEIIPNVVQALSCVKGHIYCDGCFSSLVEFQVCGAGRAAFLKSQHIISCTCPESGNVCGAIFDIRQNSQRLQPVVWKRYLDAVTETAVVAEQQKFEQLKTMYKAATGPPSALQELLAHVGTMVLPSCSQCQKVLPDFDGCLALQCGRTVNAVGLGCGANLCALCQRQFQDERAVHEHLRNECVWNPRAGDMFPRNDTKLIQYMAARERIWCHCILKCKVDEVMDAFTEIHKSWPELDMTPQWCDLRLAWSCLGSEMSLDPLQFSEQLPKYMRCAAHCVHMGFAEEPSRRAAVLHKGDVTQACITLLAETP